MRQLKLAFLTMLLTAGAGTVDQPRGQGQADHPRSSWLVVEGLLPPRTLRRTAIGLAAVNITKPGVGVNLPMGEQSPITAKPQTWDQILLHVVPESVIDAMARGDVLQIVIFSIFFAVALGMIGEKGRPYTMMNSTSPSM